MSMPTRPANPAPTGIESNGTEGTGHTKATATVTEDNRSAPSLKEPVLSRAVSADFSAWECLLFYCSCRQSAQSVRTDIFPSVNSSSWLSVPLLFVRSVLRLVRVLRLLLRGLFGRSFQHATVPLPVPSWTPADRKVRPLGPNSPDTDKIFRSSCGTPSRSIIRITPGRNGQVKGTHRAGREPQVFARRKAARINTVTWSKGISVLCLECYTGRACRGG